jgi:hypothetical protein
LSFRFETLYLTEFKRFTNSLQIQKMKKLLLLILPVILFAACKKSDDNPNPNPNPTNPYYFKFNLGGTAYNLNFNLPQYMPFYTDEVGGYQVGDGNFNFSMGLRLRWKNIDTVRESDLMGLVGKTLYFNDTVSVYPELSFDTTLVSETWYSVDTLNSNYNVKINSITFLKNDTAFNPLKVYVINGTCTAIMEESNSRLPLSSGQFNFIVSRRDY